MNRPWTTPTRGGRWVDPVLAALLIGALELNTALTHGISSHERTTTAIAALLFAAPVAVRRFVPGGALVAACSVLLIQTPLGGQLLAGGLPDMLLPGAVLLLLTYAAGASTGGVRSIVTVGTALVLVGSAAFAPGAGPEPVGIGAVGSSIFYSALLVLPGWFVGRLDRLQVRRSKAFSELAAQVTEEQGLLLAGVVSAERERIGRELQDIITHSVSSMVVQAGGARMLMSQDPERARHSIVSVEHTGREALGDLRRLLGMLRKDDDLRSLAPQPGLGQVRPLIESLHEAGLTCDVECSGPATDLTPGIDLVAYRAIETVLLSALQLGATEGKVTIWHRPDALELEVCCPGINGEAELGLVSIGERVRLYDGWLRVAPPDVEGLHVRLHLPVGLGALT
jgi:signal transduction histidine kinase